MKSFGLFVARRLALMVVSLFLLMSVTFLLVSLAPSDPARNIAGPYATEAQLAAVRHDLGLDRPLGARYLTYMDHLLHGNLGTSLYSDTTIGSQIARYLPSTAELIVAALVVAMVLGLGFALVSAYWHRRWPDRVSSSVVGVLQSVPDFVIGVVLLFVFFFAIGMLPGPEGQLSIITTLSSQPTHAALIDSIISADGAGFLDALTHAVLPVMTLALAMAAVFARVGRAALREAFESEQTKFGRAMGLPERRIVHYALLTSRTPVMTYGAIVFALGFGGTAIVETIFNWNGASQWAVKSMLRNDYPAVLGFILVVGIITLLTYFVLDIATAALDPRIRAGVH